MNARKFRRAPTADRSADRGPGDPDDWATGNQPMTGAQARYLRLLCEEAGAAFEARLTKAQASKRIDLLRTHPGHRAF
jgi:uncharacterized damage-inducible protein DinB